jgi:predicted membrane protein
MSMRGVYMHVNRLILGVFILAIGVVSLLGNLGMVRPDALQVWWPLVFCVFGIARLVRPCGIQRRLMGVVMLAVGVFLILHNLGYIAAGVHVLWPLLIMYIGASIMLRGSRRQRDEHGYLRFGDSMANEDFVEVNATMGGGKIRNVSTNFKGGNISAVMGGVQLDLRGAAMQEAKATIKVFAFWGGIEIKVPPEWTVVVSGMPILGGIEDKSVPAGEGAKQLIIEGEVIMGGVEIRN